MPIDVTRIPALEYELEQAKRVKGGGQEPRPERIAAIEEQLQIHRDALARQERTERKSDKVKADSNTSTDYSAKSKSTRPEQAPEPSYSPDKSQAKAAQSEQTEKRTDADAEPKKNKAERARDAAQQAKEDAGKRGDGPTETADAAAPTESA